MAPLGAVFVNQLLPRLFDDRTEQALARVRAARGEAGAAGAAGEAAAAHSTRAGGVDASLLHLFDVADRRRVREAREREQRLRVDGLSMPVVELPHLLGPVTAPDVLRFAELLGRTLGRAA